MKELSTILPDEWLSALDPSMASIEISGVTSDSRQVRSGMIFVATRGVSQDGHQFIDRAANAGATLILGEEEREGLSTPYLKVPDGRLALARLASNFYGNPSHSMLMVGVTGTSGKTTTTYLIESILSASGHKVGLIGTVQFRYGGKVLDSTHTTPGAVELQRLLAEMRDAGCTAVVMEVSSHALKQHRTAYLAFDAMIFTNLSREHLDFHPDMEDYFNSKAILFTHLARESVKAGKAPVASIGIETEWGNRLVTLLRSRKNPEMKRILTFSSQSGADLPGDGVKVDLDGIHGQAGGVKIESSLTGRFNVANILGAVGAALGLGMNSEMIAQGVSSLKSVPGRLESVPNSKGIHVLVDYAHKPDALEKVLQTLKSVKGDHRLITVFGCGGDRDRTKRPVMGKTAAELSDQVIVTSDNPRTEDPRAILDEILVGMVAHSNYQVELDRKKAISAAIAQADSGDVVLIAGKGHEDYQIIADSAAPGGVRKIHFDDREVAFQALLSRE